VAREYVEPTSALDMLVEETIRPAFSFLSAVVRELLGEKVPDETIHLGCMSVMGQCLFFVYAKPVIKRLTGQEKFDGKEIEMIAGHITRFSVLAIKGIGRDRKET
jgi:TetR/AcrR family transcriptional regulator, regulator of cefoperazone and chloramphenicol sensitivity